MVRTVLLSLQGNNIIINNSNLEVNVGDTVKYVSTDGNQYEIMIVNKDDFLVNNNNGAPIVGTADSDNDFNTDAVNNKPIGTVKFYSVSTPGGGTPLAPPKIIISH